MIGLKFEVIVNTVKMINLELKPSYAEGDSDAYKQVSPEIMSTTWLTYKKSTPREHHIFSEYTKFSRAGMLSELLLEGIQIKAQSATMTFSLYFCNLFTILLSYSI